MISVIQLLFLKINFLGIESSWKLRVSDRINEPEKSDL